MGCPADLGSLKVMLLMLILFPTFLLILMGKFLPMSDIAQRYFSNVTATDLPYSQDESIVITDRLADTINSFLEMKLKNITEVSNQIIRKYEDQKATREAELRDMVWNFDYARNKTFVSYSPLYKRTNGESALSNKKLNFKHEIFSRNRNVNGINCRLIFEGDEREMDRAKASEWPGKHGGLIFPSSQTTACNKFIKDRGYITDPLTEEEENFPIAYSIIVYKNPEQFEMLLRSIYRPQNFYCVHVDRNTNKSVFHAILSIIKCFPNVFLASKRYYVRWGGLGVLFSEIICMMDLVSRSDKWKYFINLTGQEFPLRTNRELVRVLTIFNGTNIVDAERAISERWALSGWPPHQIRPVKGSVHIVVNRRFAEYVVNSPIARDFLNWTTFTYIPDETFFASLNHNPHLGIPGSYKGEPETDEFKKPFLARYKNWYNHLPCGGQSVRGICVLGLSDLPLLARRPELFANKFFWEMQPHTLLCLEELHFNRTKDEFYQRLQLQTDYYESLEYLKNVV